MRLQKFLLAAIAVAAFAGLGSFAGADIVTIGLENDDATGALLDNLPNLIEDGIGPIVVQEALGTDADAVSYTHLTLPTICSV